MNEFSRENKHLSETDVIDLYQQNIMNLKKIIKDIRLNKSVTDVCLLNLCIFFSNYTSGTKTIICKYLHSSNLTKNKLNSMSVPELFVKFKKQISKDMGTPCMLSTELHLVAFDLRNKLSHTINQQSYLSKVIHTSGINKIIRFLDKLEKESSEIHHYFKIKVENNNSITENLNNESLKEINQYPYGIHV